MDGLLFIDIGNTSHYGRESLPPTPAREAVVRADVEGRTIASAVDHPERAVLPVLEPARAVAPVLPSIPGAGGR
jgi:hypothetical protein